MQRALWADYVPRKARVCIVAPCARGSRRSARIEILPHANPSYTSNTFPGNMMMRICTIDLLKRSAYALIVAALATTHARAQTLDSLISIAETTHPSVSAARLAIDRADARARSVEAWEAPRVGLEIADLPLNNPNPFSRGETMLMVEQTIPLFGQNRAMARAERYGVAVAESEIANVRRELAARVERQYIALWLLERRRALNGDSRSLADAMFRTSEGQYAVGRAPQSDLFRATVEVERLGNERRAIDIEHAEVLARLNALLGRADTVQVVVNESLAAATMPQLDALDTGIAGHPSLRRMEAMAAMSRAEADAQDAMLDPMLMVTGGLSFAPEGHAVREGSDMLSQLTGEHASQVVMDDPMRWGISVGAMISIPIASWSRSGPEALAESFRIDAQQQLLQRDAMQREMTVMLRGAVAEARRAEMRRDYHLRTQIPLLEKTLKSLSADYATGRVPFTSVIDGYSMLVMARMDAYMQEMEYAMALTMIYEIAGVSR